MNNCISYNIHKIFHNESLIKSCEDTINAFIDNGSTIWLEDDEGNCFIPKGHVKIGMFEIREEE